MVETETANINGNVAIEVEIGNAEFPEEPAISVLLANNGLIVCRNFDMDALDKRLLAAARVTGLTKIEEALDAKIESCTLEAKALSIVEGITGKETSKKTRITCLLLLGARNG